MGRTKPKRRRLDKAAAVASDGGEDRISALPDDALHHILSFLPSDDTVSTSLLARRWRHLWSSTRAVRVTRRDPPRYAVSWTPRTLNHFVNRLLLLRGGAPLEEFEISCGEIDDDPEIHDYEFDNYESRTRRNEEVSHSAGPWIRHALTVCQARALSLSVCTFGRRLQIVTRVFVSEFLTRLHLTDATLKFRALDLSGCPALQELDMIACRICVDRILSQSLIRLGIDGCDFDSKVLRCRISTPRLISMRLTVSYGRAPVLDSMPTLFAAQVRLQDGCKDICEHNNSYYGDCVDGKCGGCYGIGSDGSNSVFLQGLSDATDLELTSNYPSVFILRKDLKFCTMFTKLKTLLLNEWCMEPDFGALVYFLRYSPVMEKLTILLENDFQRTHDVVVADENEIPPKRFSVSKQLKTVKIKWYKNNELVPKVSIILSTYGVLPEQIIVEEVFNLPVEDYHEEGYSSDNWY